LQGEVATPQEYGDEIADKVEAEIEYYDEGYDCFCDACAGGMTETDYYEKRMLVCGHRYCTTCIKSMFDIALAAQPPREASCCGLPISFTYFGTDLGQETLEKIKALGEESTTRHRVYCFKAACSKFLGDANTLKGFVACDQCQTQTCAVCQAPAEAHGEDGEHPGYHGREDRELAKQMKWQQCPSKCRVEAMSVRTSTD